MIKRKKKSKSRTTQSVMSSIACDMIIVKLQKQTWTQNRKGGEYSIKTVHICIIRVNAIQTIQKPLPDSYFLIF